jgi:L-cysteine S-thiosulfotransferase
MRPLARALFCLLAGGVLAGGLLADSVSAESTKPTRDYLSPDIRATQDDPSRHPGWLWVEQGETLWQQAPASGKPACAGCHGDVTGMKGVAARYPAVASDGALLNLELRIEGCRTQQQAAPAFGYESEALLSLTTLIALQSRGMPVTPRLDGPAQAFRDAGERLYAIRQGQLNLACGQCHDDNAGRRLRGDTISNGLGTGYPAYRLEWNGVGSLHRRLRACSLGVRATQFALGSPEYLALELYLAERARGLVIEAPGLRR